MKVEMFYHSKIALKKAHGAVERSSRGLEAT